MNKLLDKIGHIAQLFVTFATVAGFFGVIIMLLRMNNDLLMGIKDTLLVLIGVLAGAYKDICSYWLGSSLGAAKMRESLTGTANTGPSVTTVVQKTETLTTPAGPTP